MSSNSKKSRYALIFDVGTTNIKAGVIDLSSFKAVDKASVKAEVIYPRHGYAEVDPEVLWMQILDLTSRLSREYLDEVSGIVFTAHMAGVLPVDDSLNPLRNIIIWLDERAAGLPEDVFHGLFKVSGYNLIRLIEFLRVTGGAPSKTGKDPISKMVWIRDYEPDIYNSTYKFVDVKGFLIMKATGEIVTSVDEAHLTWLADTRDGKVEWYPNLFKRYGLDISKMSTIKYSTEIAGYLKGDASSEFGVKEGIPVYVGAGDLASAAVGSGAVKDYEPHIYLGSSSWIAAHTPKRLVDLSHYMGSLASGIPGRYIYIAEQEVAGSSLDYISKILSLSDGYEAVDNLASQASPGSNGLMFMPWLFGERSPVDDPFLRGGFLNIGFEHDRGDYIRSVMEGVAYNIRWSLHYFQRKIHISKGIKVVGGGVKSDIWCQILADVLGLDVIRIFEPENAALRGGAVFAAVGSGVYKGFSEAVSNFSVDRVFTPDSERHRLYNRLFDVFKKLYKKLNDVYRSLNV